MRRKIIIVVIILNILTLFIFSFFIFKYLSEKNSQSEGITNNTNNSTPTSSVEMNINDDAGNHVENSVIEEEDNTDITVDEQNVLNNTAPSTENNSDNTVPQNSRNDVPVNSQPDDQKWLVNCLELVGNYYGKQVFSNKIEVIKDFEVYTGEGQNWIYII